MPAVPPPTIPGHTHVRYLASGGAGDVFLFRDNLGREVAIKVLRLQGLTDAALEAFKVEASRMVSIDSDHVVTVHGFDVAADGRPYLSMEYCPDNLADVAARTTLPVADVLRHTIQLCSAVDAAHRADMFHRDIKPANVLLTTSGRPVLTDFGIASGRDVDADARRGMTLRYAAPEVVAGRTPGAELADVYSIGATLYVLLAGRAPFEVPGGDNSEAALTDRTLQGGPTPTGRSDVPASLERVLQRALAREPEHRFRSAAALANALQEIEIELGFPPTQVPLGPVTPTRAPRPGPAADDDGTRFAGPRRVGAAPQGVTARDTAAEPARPAARRPAEPPPPSTAPAAPVPEDGTRARGPARVEAPAPEPATEQADEEAAEAPSRRRGLAVAAVAVLVVAGGLGAAAMTSDGAVAEDAEPAAATSTDDAPPDGDLFAQPTVPTGVTVSADGSDLQVAWDADPVDGVSYVVVVTEGPAAGTSEATDQTTHTVADAVGDGRACVEVLAVLGSTSTGPSREECTP